MQSHSHSDDVGEQGATLAFLLKKTVSEIVQESLLGLNWMDFPLKWMLVAAGALGCRIQYTSQTMVSRVSQLMRELCLWSHERSKITRW